MNTRLEFGGFYESMHSNLIDQAVEMYHADENGYFDYELVSDTVGLDWDAFRDAYMHEWARLFELWLEAEYELKVHFTNLKLWSPRFYNFRTDEIDCELTEREVQDILDKFDKDEAIDNYIRQETQNRDGFMSFYTYDEAKANKEGVGLQLILRYLADSFNLGQLMDYYDRQNSYERIL
jgi:multidrug efflux pump subunit AcrB